MQQVDNIERQVAQQSSHAERLNEQSRILQQMIEAGVDDNVLPELRAQLQEINGDMLGIQESLLDDAVVKHNISKALSEIEGEKAEIEHTLAR